MNIASRVGIFAATVGLMANMQSAKAVVAGHRLQANAVNSCQAFKPGPASDIRNRAIGVENVGPSTNVVCSFLWMYNGDDAGAALPNGLLVYFGNNNTVGNLKVTCTLLVGFAGNPAYAVTKTTDPIPPGGGDGGSLVWTRFDNPSPGAVDLGSSLININCALPSGAQINDTYINWNQDNGVGD